MGYKYCINVTASASVLTDVADVDYDTANNTLTGAIAKHFRYVKARQLNVQIDFCKEALLGESSLKNTTTMVERIEDLNLPNAVITRLIKEGLPDNANVSKEASRNC
ncbi:hypothetical protein DOY81_010832 [Sarcophaga bullata]|nr:hypothetical protein DOY81_010832 [Sarcophaga bullata]